MFHVPDYYEDVSLKLSAVLEEIAVNERTVLKRRRTNLINETIDTITETIWGFNHSVYYFGSQSEGTTTEGLESDLDTLYCNHNINVIEDWAQWKPGLKNLLMIQDEDVTPGYCFLQALRDDAPLPCSEPPLSNFMFGSSYIKDSKGRLLLQNTGTYHGIPEGDERHGPSWLLKGDSGFLDQDKVDGHPCASWPRSASRWLERNGSGNWPTADVKRYAEKSTCFVVGVGSKVSENIELEWRISSSLAERCLMFNLNITQIRCYVLMKMILKRFLNPHGRNNLSSFMCKTVLMHCVERTVAILDGLEKHFNETAFESVCCCSYFDQSYLRQNFLRACFEENEEAIQNHISSCLRYLYCEINCIPTELRYELFRQGGFRIAGREISTLPGYFSWALVDSLPYLYFLQYKTYGHLKKHQNQQKALSNLLRTIKIERNLGHREVAWNLLGQCLERECRIENALYCYISSIRLLEMNNAARWHLCKLLSKISNLWFFAKNVIGSKSSN